MNEQNLETKDLEVIFNNLQLTEWTPGIWQGKDGELWFAVSCDEKELTLGLTIIDSEFRMGDAFGQCPILHECELDTVKNNHIDCDSLALFIYFSSIEKPFNSNKVFEIIKYSWEMGKWHHDLYHDMVFVQENEYELQNIMDELDLSLSEYRKFMYRYVQYMTNTYDLNDKLERGNWYFNTPILFPPTEDKQRKIYMKSGYPYTNILLGPPVYVSSIWELYFCRGGDDFDNLFDNRELVAAFLPAALLGYVACENRKTILGDEKLWEDGFIDFKSKEVTWAFRDSIDVNDLDFYVNGAAFYNAYWKEMFDVAKKQLETTPGFELVTDNEIWDYIYQLEKKHWENDCRLKEILPDHIFTQYSQYIEAYFAYFRKMHPCVSKTKSNDNSIEQSICKHIEVVFTSDLFRIDKNELDVCRCRFQEIITTTPQRGKQKVLSQLLSAANTLYFNPSSFGHEELAAELNRLQNKFVFTKADIDAAYKKS